MAVDPNVEYFLLGPHGLLQAPTDVLIQAVADTVAEGFSPEETERMFDELIEEGFIGTKQQPPTRVHHLAKLLEDLKRLKARATYVHITPR